nr:DUF3867 domain-containing protein [Clostridium bornimense]
MIFSKLYIEVFIERGEFRVTDIIDFNKAKNKARDEDVNQFENYIYDLYYSLSQGSITMSDLYSKINEYMVNNNISQEKFLNIQNEMLSRYGIDSEDIRNQLKTMGVDLPSLDNDFDYEMARKNLGFTEKYKAGISNATYTTYKISNEKNNLDILLKDTEMIIKSEGKVNLYDNELNEFICSYKKLYSDNKINVSIFENVKTYEY